MARGAKSKQTVVNERIIVMGCRFVVFQALFHATRHYNLKQNSVKMVLMIQFISNDTMVSMLSGHCFKLSDMQVMSEFLIALF